VTIVGEEIANPHKHFSNRHDAEKFIQNLEGNPSFDYQYADIQRCLDTRTLGQRLKPAREGKVN
jgi:hypothetical protein